MKEEIVTEKRLIKINLPGGIVAAGDLLDILNAAEKAGISQISLGNRQQLFLSIPDDRLEDIEEEFLISDVDYEIDGDRYPNIISSYVSEDIFSVSNWLREGVYKDILDGFDFKPRLKINLADNNQTFIPFFTGNLNYIASEISNFWYLHIRFPKTNTFYSWPNLIYTEDIAALSNIIEENIFQNSDLLGKNEQIEGQVLFRKIDSLKRFIQQRPPEPLKLPDFELPYYEGFNKYDNKFWLGIYKRDEEYSVNFLKDICSVCLQTRVGQIYTTPWKSLIIKDIYPQDRKSWNWILAKNRINVRHASNELNWQVEDQCEYGLKLKQHLADQFNRKDLRTFRLCFAVKINPKSGLFGSVIIKKQIQNEENEPDLFDILYTKDFNPNSKDFVTYSENVQYSNLAGHLIELCEHYYTLQTGGDSFPAAEKAAEKPAGEEENKIIVYQCKNCLTVYDPIYGDDINNISAGTGFHSLPETWSCPTCDTPKSDFIEVDSKELGFIS